MLQLFEARWSTVEDRAVDIFQAGYGGLWLPPPGRADSGGLSAGYDVFDRFDLGQPRNETLYGTETGLKTAINAAHRAGVNVYTDLVLNHNGFRDSSTPGFVAAGDYPGFVVTLSAEDDPAGVGDIDGDFHLIYGVAGPQGQVRLTDAAGADLADVLAGGTPTAQTNGTTRLADITVVSDDTFKVRLETTAVNLLGSVRDRHADGDAALLKIDGGVDLNSLPGVDQVEPGSVLYGFEAFDGIDQPGFFQADGNGLYEQTIAASELAEGTHFLTVRAFRHRDPATTTGGDPATAGDGGPAVFTDFRRAIYVDRLPPEAEIVSFDPFASQPGTPENRDLIARSSDGTADNMHIFLDLPAALTDAEIFQLTQAGQGNAGTYDRDQWIFGFFGVESGNHVATVVTFEPTGNVNIQRFPGQATATGIGAGVGDLDFDGAYQPGDVGGLGNGSFEDVLYSQNSLFNPAADVNADGLVDNRDLYGLDEVLTAAGADQATLAEYTATLRRRGNVDQTDLDLLMANLLVLGDMDLDADVDFDDIDDLVLALVDPAAYADLRGVPVELHGDLDKDGNLDFDDIAGFVTELSSSPGTLNQTVPEPASQCLALVALAILSFVVPPLGGLRAPIEAA